MEKWEGIEHLAEAALAERGIESIEEGSDGYLRATRRCPQCESVWEYSVYDNNCGYEDGDGHRFLEAIRELSNWPACADCTDGQQEWESIPRPAKKRQGIPTDGKQCGVVGRPVLRLA